MMPVIRSSVRTKNSIRVGLPGSSAGKIIPVCAAVGAGGADGVSFSDFAGDLTVADETSFAGVGEVFVAMMGGDGAGAFVAGVGATAGFEVVDGVGEGSGVGFPFGAEVVVAAESGRDRSVPGN